MDTFVCAMCGGTFEKNLNEAEVIAEFEENFGLDYRPEEVASVCDGCYEKIHPEDNPHMVEEAV